MLKWSGPDELGYYYLWLGPKPKGAYHPSWDGGHIDSNGGRPNGPQTWGKNGWVPLKVSPPQITTVRPLTVVRCRT